MVKSREEKTEKGIVPTIVTIQIPEVTTPFVLNISGKEEENSFIATNDRSNELLSPGFKQPERDSGDTTRMRDFLLGITSEKVRELDNEALKRVNLLANKILTQESLEKVLPIIEAELEIRGLTIRTKSIEEEKALTTENASGLKQPIVGDPHDEIKEFLLSLDESKVKELSDLEVLDLFKKAKLFETTGKAIQILGKELEERGLGIAKSDAYFMEKSDKKYPFLIVRGIKNVLSKQEQKYLRDQLVTITKETKKSQKPLLEKLWKDLNLGFLCAPLKIVKDDRFFIKNFISYIPPENTDFNKDNLIILGESKDYICLGTNVEKDIKDNFVDKTILKWYFNPRYVLQFPFDTQDGFVRIETKHKREMTDYQEEENILQKTEKVLVDFVPYLDKKISFYNVIDENTTNEEFRFIDSGEYLPGIHKSDEYHEYFLSSDVEKGRLVCKKIENDWYIRKTEESLESFLDSQENKSQKTEKAFCFIEKVNQEKRMVYGPVLIPEEVDGQGDIISKEVIQEAAWNFLEEYGTVSFMHTASQTVEGIKHQVEHAMDMKYSVEQLFYGTNDPLLPGIQKVLGRPRTFSDKLKVRESYLAPADFKLGSKQIKEGTWIMGSYVISDLLWEDVKAGKLRGYSIGGEAEKNPD